MRLVFSPQGWSDHIYWQSTDYAKVQRINRLLDSARKEPFGGLGHPAPLRHLLTGCWARRIDGEHRLVYLVEGDDIVVLQERYHYVDPIDLDVDALA
jgi:toxin YoeB